jgi:hypothetical protein
MVLLGLALLSFVTGAWLAQKDGRAQTSNQLAVALTPRVQEMFVGEKMTFCARVYGRHSGPLRVKWTFKRNHHLLFSRQFSGPAAIRSCNVFKAAHTGRFGIKVQAWPSSEEAKDSERFWVVTAPPPPK